MNTKPIPFEQWKNANPDLVESAKECKFCDGKGHEKCPLCKGDGYTEDEGKESALCSYCRGEGMIQCDYCRGEKTMIRQVYLTQYKRELSLLQIDTCNRESLMFQIER